MFGSGGHWFFSAFQSLGRHRELLQKAAAIYEGFSSLRSKLRGKQVVGSAGAGLVEVEMNALGEVVACKVDPELLKPEEKEFLEGLLVEAMNAALRKAAAAQAEAMQEAARHMDLGAMRSVLNGIFGGEEPGASEEDD